MARPKKISGKLIKTRFGANLRHQMELLDHNNSTLAEELGVNRTEVWRYCQGLTMPAWDRYARLCNALKVDPTVLLQEVR